MFHTRTDRQGHTDPALASGILWPVGFVSMLVMNPASRCLFRTAIDKGVVKDQKPDWLRKKRNNHSGQLHPKCNPGPFTPLEPTLQEAVSSPLSTVRSNENDRPFPGPVRWSTTIRVNRSITPNSPSSLICIAHKLYNMSWYSKCPGAVQKLRWFSMPNHY